MIFYFYKKKLLIQSTENNEFIIPEVSETTFLDKAFETEEFHWKETPLKAVELAAPPEKKSQLTLMHIRYLYESIDKSLFDNLCFAFHILQWDKNTQFCGRCGGKNSFQNTPIRKFCISCEHTIYPTVSPAVIVAIVKDNTLLLARSPRFTSGLYSVLAGYVDPGESLEECVRREVNEEVGITIKNIAYFSSQPWAFSQSLMIGFTAEYESGEFIFEDEEIVEADWYSPHNLPEIPGKLSIARALIDWFCETYGS